jgi:hypothetical protein
MSWLLERAIDVLAGAAGRADVDLAQTCRGVLDVLSNRGLGTLDSVEGAGSPLAGEVASARHLDAPLTPPAWATSSRAEDGCFIHEKLSNHRPRITAGGRQGREWMRTEVSVSVSDLLIDGRWIRRQPTIQVEGGSYTIDGVLELQAALADLLTLLAEHDVGTTTAPYGRPLP